MKKILAICIVAIFLITSLGIISAAEDSNSISVKVIGDDLPDQIKVDLLCDGKVVDTAILDSTNSWKTTFKVDDDGDYKIKTDDISDYSITVKGDADKGFVITTKLVEQDVLGAVDAGEPDDDDVIAAEDDSLDDGIIAANEGNSSNGVLTANNTNNSTGNSTDDNSTSDDNSTEDNATAVGSSNDDTSAPDKAPAKKTVTKKVTKKTVTKKVNKPANNTKTKYKTGFPVVVLVLAAMVAIFVPFVRKR